MNKYILLLLLLILLIVSLCSTIEPFIGSTIYSNKNKLSRYIKNTYYNIRENIKLHINKFIHKIKIL